MIAMTTRSSIKVKARRIETTFLRADARGARDYVPFQEDVEVVVRLRNVGASDVVIHPPTGSGPDAVSGTTLVLSVRRTDMDIYAAELERSWTQPVALLRADAEPLRLPPESSYEVRVRIPAEEAGAPISGLRVLLVGGEVRATRIEAGDAEPLGRLAIRPGRIVVLPRNYEPLAADPLGSLRKAVAADAPIHLLVAAEFVREPEREAAVGVLAGALSSGPPELKSAIVGALRLLRRASAGRPLRPLARPLIAEMERVPARAAELGDGLHALAGVSLPPQAPAWMEWWRRELAGPGAPVPADEGAPQPAPSRDERSRP
jgi:hypothetical protein